MSDIADVLNTLNGTGYGHLSDVVTTLMGERDELAAKLRSLEAQKPEYWYLPAEDEDGEDALLHACRDGTSPAVGALPLFSRPAPASQDDCADRVANICNAYESGVGHRGRPTAHVNPYPRGSDESIAYALGAIKEHHGMAASQDAGDADDATCEALIEASDMRWNGDVYIGDGSDLMNLVRAAILAAKKGDKP